MLNMKKTLCALLALVLALGCGGLAEAADPEARIAELEAQVEILTAELEAANATIREFEEQDYVVTFDGGHVALAEAKEQYGYISSMYESYGISITGYEDYLKDQVMHMLAESAVEKAKAAELGLGELSEEELAAYEAEARTAYNSNIMAYLSYFMEDGKSEEDARADAEAYLEGQGYSYESVLSSMVDTHVQEALYNHVTADIEVTEEDVRAAFETAAAENETAYTGNAYAYESARTNGEPVYWNPAGYRRVKHILVKFDDDQTTRYSELAGLIDDLEGRIEAAEDGEEALEEEIAEPGEGEEAAIEEAAEATDATEAAAEDEETEPVDVEELQAQLTEARAQLNELYEELLPKAEEVIERFNSGEDFEALLAEYGEDPGMQQEPGITEGYYVSADSEMWEQAFTDGAMSIEGVGQISDPVYGSNGIHIIYYLADVPEGIVDFETVHDALEESTLSSKQSEAYDAQLSQWMEELNVEYHLDRFK